VATDCHLYRTDRIFLHYYYFSNSNPTASSLLHTMILIETNRDGPHTKPCLLHSGTRKASGTNEKATTEKCTPPPVVFIGEQRVSFDDTFQVLEYETSMSEEDKDLLWYDETDESENFRIVRAESNDSEDDDSVETICSNHARRVLLNYECYKRLGNGSDLLRTVSRKSSHYCRNKARKEAVHLSKAVHTWAQPRDDSILGFGYDSRIADYYIETMLDTLMERNWLCGALLSMNE
jgi:hypothetical protein